MNKKSSLIFSTFFLALSMLLCPSSTKLSATSCLTTSGATGVFGSDGITCVPVLDINNPGTISNNSSGKSGGGLIPCGHGNSPANACTLCDFIVGFKKLVDFGTTLLITVALVGIFFSGVIYIVSSGNEGLVTKAKTFLSASLVGFTIVLGAWLIVNVIMWALSYNTSVIGQTDWHTFDCTSTTK